MGNRVFWISNHSVRLRALKSSFNANHWINSSLNAFMEGLCLGSLSVDLCNKSSRGARYTSFSKFDKESALPLMN